MVGHTHADVDQKFSCLSKYLHKNSSFTMEGNNNTDIRMYIFVNYRQLAFRQLCTLAVHCEKCMCVCVYLSIYLCFSIRMYSRKRKFKIAKATFR